MRFNLTRVRRPGCFATGVLGGVLPTNQSQYLPTFVFVAVILVLLVRPRGLFDFSRTVERV